MTQVLVVGDGPGGLSAALFLAKKGMEVTVFGVDQSDMHRAMLYNYLGIPEISGSDFQKIARDQVKGFGATIHDVRVTGIERAAEGFLVVEYDLFGYGRRNRDAGLDYWLMVVHHKIVKSVGDKPSRDREVP